MDGLINFRDFGGKPTRFGLPVARDLLYRSGHMAQAQEPAISRMVALDFGLIVDLRYPEERKADRSPWPEQWHDRVIAHSGDSAEAPHRTMLSAAMTGLDAIDRAYADLYAALPFDPDYRPLFCDALRRAARGAGRILIHCSAGKDRTGLLAALFLDTLGVARTDIIDDYLLSAAAPQLLTPRLGIVERLEGSGQRMSAQAIQAMLGVKAQYLEAAFATIEREAGSIEAYLDAGGLDAETRSRLLARFLCTRPDEVRSA